MVFILIKHACCATFAHLWKMKHYRKIFKLKTKLWHESRSFRRTDYTPFPQQDFNQGLPQRQVVISTTLPSFPPNLFMTHIYRCFHDVLMKRATPREFHTLKKSFITILSSSDNCYFSKQSLPPEWVPGDIVLEMIIQQAKNYAPSFSSYKTSMQRLLTEISEITLLISHCHKQADMGTDFIRYVSCEKQECSQRHYKKRNFFHLWTHIFLKMCHPDTQLYFKLTCSS